MDNIQLPKTCRFKKLVATEAVYIGGGFASNRHWIFNTAWLLNLPRRRDLGMINLLNRVSKAQVNAVQARLNDERYPTYDLEALVKATDLKKYRPAKCLNFELGFFKGNPNNYTAVAMSFGTNSTAWTSPWVDVEYSAAFYFDADTTVMHAGPNEPVAIVKAGEIVGLIAPLNPATLKEYVKSKKQRNKK